MGLNHELRVIYACYLLYVFVFGVAIVAIEGTSFNVAISLIVLPLVIYAVIKFFAVPKPANSVVKEILGVDVWWQYKERYLNGLNNVNVEENSDLVFRTIAHRAAGLDAPENSISALKRSKEKGCNFVEIDLSLTKDDVPIVFHDHSLDRMIGVHGYVQDFTWDELKNYDLIYQPDVIEKKMYRGEKIALFDEFIDLCVELGVRVFIDIKDKKDEVVKVILQTYEKHPSLFKTSLVTSFNPFILYKIRRSNPKIICSMAWRPNYFSKCSYDPFMEDQRRYSSTIFHTGAVLVDYLSTWLFNNIVYYIIGLSVVLLHKDSVSQGTISMWQNRNIRVIAWTVNSKLEKDYFSNIYNIPYMTDTLDYNHIKISGDK